MISEKNQRKLQLSKDELLSSKLSPDEKEDLADALESCLEGTNGLTPDEKLQNVSESVFTLMRLHVRARCSMGIKSWKDVLVSCKRELMWTAFGFFFLLFFHPELAAILKEAAK